MTKRQAILTALVARVSAIAIAAGFATDAGATVFLGEAAELGPDDPDAAIALVLEDDSPQDKGYLYVQLPIAVAALAKADLETPWLTIEAIVGDIKRAVEHEDRTLGGLLKGPMTRGATRTLTREPGSTTVGASVTYICSYVEAWGDPG
jgi:hypothetical protein